MSRPDLNDAEKNSPLWAKLKEYWLSRLEDLRRENDSDQTDIKTARLRGRIAETKLMLSLDQPKPKIEEDD